MGRKNSNAGQPNRTAQKFRRADHLANRVRDDRFPTRTDVRVLGPGSEHLQPVPNKGARYGDTEIHTTVLVKSELVAA
jgi:hypothetical protein